MPEGDTIFRAARTLHRALAGHVVTRFETQYAHIARVHDDAPITGRVVEKVESRGKHLLIYFTGTGYRVPGTGCRLPDQGGHEPGIGSRESGVVTPATIAGTRRGEVEGPLVLRTHMLMSGSWHIYRAGEEWQRSPASARVVVGTATFVAVGFTVPIAEFVPTSALEEDDAIGRLGPDVLAPEFDAVEAMARLAASARPTVAEALLEQRAVAGIGNVFKSEILFLAGLWPFVPPAAVSKAHWTRMMRDARVLLQANVIDPAEAGVLTWRGARRTTGRSNPGERLYVYGRQGRPCRRCGTAILLRHHGEHNRSTYWCPSCQAAPRRGEPVLTGED
jgi:endonuclease-8